MHFAPLSQRERGLNGRTALREVIVTFPVERNGRTVAGKLQPFTLRQNLPNAGKRRAKIIQRDVQRATIEFRHGEAQLVIFATGKRPAQCLLGFNVSANLFRQWERIQINARAHTAGFQDMT
ncbi:hypothetical protein D3C86_1911740 [compost metagenome]